ncbi:hypothetical protein VTN77DRAFT_2292 [Rasamsonia byssochlamydoides]|uniref:uncharacterized protein n=1 Tax=Rasamsonia byssochlamydoides TaxID=89139 RepID=UPI0037440F7F
MAGFWTELLASEIYLLERWDSSSGETALEQRDRLFRDYVQMGIAGRWRYHQAAQSRNYERPTEDQIKSILERVRTVEQRAAAMLVVRGHHRAWLRIDYGLAREPGPNRNPMEEHTEDVLTRATSDNQTKVNFLFLNDRTHYDYDDWHQLLTCIPEVLDSHMGPKRPAEYRQSIRGVKAEAKKDVMSNSEDMHEYIRASAHWAWVTGIIWVHDEKTTQSGEINLIWMDEFGRAVREARLSSWELHLGYDFPAPDMRNPWWTIAKEGGDYAEGKWPSTSVEPTSLPLHSNNG